MSKCVLCCNHGETDLNLFFTCPVSSSFLQWLLQGLGLAQSLNITISASAVWSAFSEGRNDASTECAAMFLFSAIHCIWQSKIDSIFKNSAVSLLRIKRHLVEQVAEMISGFVERPPQDRLLLFSESFHKL